MIFKNKNINLFIYFNILLSFFMLFFYLKKKRRKKKNLKKRKKWINYFKVFNGYKLLKIKNNSFFSLKNKKKIFS